MNTTSREAFIALAKNNEWIKKCGVDLKIGKDGEYPFYYDEANTLYSMYLAALSVDKDGEAVADSMEDYVEATVELDKLIKFFRYEAFLSLGNNGDNMGWTPAETAIAAMRELLTMKSSKGSENYKTTAHPTHEPA